MKFSIVIPTQDRPELMALAVHYALTQNYGDIELIVSDNSTTDDYKEKNKLALEGHIQDNRLLLVSPPKVLSAPEHFEFALQYATGDYVLYLTDKMMLLSDTLVRTELAIRETGAEIVNWLDVIVPIEDFQKTAASGVLEGFSRTSDVFFHTYDPISELEAKASGFIPRTNQSKENYITGKICFGCFSRGLIERIRKYSGGLFGGITHDYSAMTQGLSVSKECVMLDSPGIIFVSLPVDKSLGMLTYLQSAAALNYYKSFSNPDAMLSSLLIPNLYSSQHNMVASDYVKYLDLYKKPHFFIEKYWLRSIGLDLLVKDRIWINDTEKKSQQKLFSDFLYERPAARVYWYFYLVGFRLAAIKSQTENSIISLLKKSFKALPASLREIISKRVWR